MKLRKRHIALIVLLISPLGAYALLTFTTTAAMRQSIDDTRMAMEQSSLTCPDGHSVRVDMWSKSGLSRACVLRDVLDGPWEAWEKGHLVVRGHYKQGARSGIWTWYNDTGGVVRVRDFARSSDTQHSPQKR